MAAALARSTTRPEGTKESEGEITPPCPGDLLPIALDISSETVRDSPVMQALSRHWSTEAFKRCASGFDLDTPLELCVVLAPPQSPLIRALTDRARQVATFRNLSDTDFIGRDERFQVLDERWMERQTIDLESGRIPWRARSCRLSAY